MHTIISCFSSAVLFWHRDNWGPLLARTDGTKKPLMQRETYVLSPHSSRIYHKNDSNKKNVALSESKNCGGLWQILVCVTIITFNLHLMQPNREVGPWISSCTLSSSSYITVIDICIRRQLSKTTSLARGRSISLKCKWDSEKRFGVI